MTAPSSVKVTTDAEAHITARDSRESDMTHFRLCTHYCVRNALCWEILRQHR